VPAVEDHVEDRPRAFQLPPVLDLGERQRAVLPGAHRGEHIDLAGALGVGQRGGVDGEHAAVDERARADADRLEVGRRRRAGVGGIDHAHVGARSQRERLPSLEVVGGDQHPGRGLRQARVAEVPTQAREQPAGVVALVDQPPSEVICLMSERSKT
jgi:hypothetical protein